MKKIITACIDEIIEFDTPAEAAEYLQNLRDSGKDFRYKDQMYIGSKVRLRIKKQYNNTPLME